jgi:hypothetical protein
MPDVVELAITKRQAHCPACGEPIQPGEVRFRIALGEAKINRALHPQCVINILGGDVRVPLKRFSKKPLYHLRFAVDGRTVNHCNPLAKTRTIADTLINIKILSTEGYPIYRFFRPPELAHQTVEPAFSLCPHCGSKVYAGRTHSCFCKFKPGLKEYAIIPTRAGPTLYLSKRDVLKIVMAQNKDLLHIRNINELKDFLG